VIAVSAQLETVVSAQFETASNPVQEVIFPSLRAMMADFTQRATKLFPTGHQTAYTRNKCLDYARCQLFRLSAASPSLKYILMF